MFFFNKVKRKAEEEKLAEVMAGNAELGLSNSLFCLMAQSTPSMLIPPFSGNYHLVGPSGSLWWEICWWGIIVRSSRSG